MASLQKRSGPRGNTFRIQFYDAQQTRQSIRLGRIAERHAGEIFRRVETIIECRSTGEPPDAVTAQWLRSVGPGLRKLLENVGLIKPVDADAATRGHLGPFLDAYTAGRSDVKPATLLVLGHTKRCLKAYFGDDKPVASITRGDMDDWRLWLLKPKAEKDGGQGLSENTVRRRSGIARQYFNSAVRKKLITENPADHLPVTVRGSKKKRFFVTEEMAAKIIDKCPDAEWRVMFALARWGGLRVPSEAMQLMWRDIDWVAGRIRVRSPKTEHHEGGEERLIPLFPELEKILDEALDQSANGAVFIINRYRRPGQNVGTQLARIIRKAGLEPWPKLWVNLRATRATELFSKYPKHVAESWMGHCYEVATEHYLSVPEEHFEEARKEFGAKVVLYGAAPVGSSEPETPIIHPKSSQANRSEAVKQGNWALQDLNL